MNKIPMYDMVALSSWMAMSHIKVIMKLVSNFVDGAKV